MDIAVYRSRETGEICRVHGLKDLGNMSVEEATKQYNSAGHSDTAEVVALQENSLEMFLYRRAKLSIKDYREDIENMSDTLDSLMKSLEWLCGKVKDKE